MHTYIYIIDSSNQDKEFDFDNVYYNLLDSDEQFFDSLSCTNFDDAIKSLFKTFKELGVSDYVEYNHSTQLITFKEGFREKYFEQRWNIIVNRVNSVNAFKDFCGDVDSYTLHKLITETDGYYWCEVTGAVEPFDDYVRYLNKPQTLKVYGVISYHR